MLKLLVTGFEPFGLYGRIFKRNESEVFAKRLKELYPNVDIVILPVEDKCKRILRKNISKIKPDLVFMLGSAGDITRIETVAQNGCNRLQSTFAKDIKEEVKDIKFEHIGDWYCNDVYYESLARIPNSIFIHLSYLPNFEKVKKIFELAISKISHQKVITKI